MQSRKPKTVNNALIILKAMIRVAVDLDAIRIAPCGIPLLNVPRREMTFYDFIEFDRGVAAADDTASQLVVLSVARPDCGAAR